MRFLSRKPLPVDFETDERMRDAVAEVFAGEYESGYSGEGLTIADIGANVGAFALWANARWPASSITAFEPHPRTFAMLQRNCAATPNITPVNAAVFPTDQEEISFSAAYDGDGEAMVAECVERTFGRTRRAQQLTVPVLHPSGLKPADIIKIDAEGAEADIIHHLDLSSTSLLLIEYQNDANRQSIKKLVTPSFEMIFEDSFSWNALLGHGYNPNLLGDHYGHLFFVRKGSHRLRRESSVRLPRRLRTTLSTALLGLGLR